MGVNGPVTRTVLTLDCGVAIISPLSGLVKEKIGTKPCDYADNFGKVTAIELGVFAEVGIIQRSA